VRRARFYGASAVSQFRPYSAQTEEVTASEEPFAPLIVRDEVRVGRATSGIGPGLAGALAAALVGGIIWGYVIIKTDYEVGFLAWGLGFIAGYAVLTLAGGRRSIELQLIASVGAVLGIVIGKYVAYVHFFQDYVRATFGEEFASRVSYFDTQIVRYFVDDFTSLLSGFDIVWCVLAVATAWRIVRPGPAGGVA